MILQVDNLSFRYGRRWVLENLSFSVATGDFVGIVGPNGIGKTTLLKLLYRLMAPQRGRIVVDGTNLAAMTRGDISRKIAVVSQETQINFPFSALEVVLMGRSPHLKGLQFEGQRDFDAARKAMELTDTLHVAHRPFKEISGGEKQRIFIARALAQETDMVLLDEPTANLDIRHQIQFYDLMTRLNEEKGIAVVTVSHDINLASEFCKTVLLLHQSRIFGFGEPHVVITKKNIETVYDTPVLVDQNPETGAPRVTLLRRNRPARNRTWS